MPSRPPKTTASVFRFARAFWTAFGSIAVVAGLYLGAVEAQLTLVFWIALAASAAIGVVVIAWRPMTRAIQQVRNYPSLVSEVEDLRLENEHLRTTAARLQPEREEAYRQGIAEGEERTEGAFLALLGEPPEIVDVTMADSLGMKGGPAFLCRTPEVEPPYHARFIVVTRNTKKLMGVVAVHSGSYEGHMTLECVDETVPQFWEDIRDRIAAGRGAPDGVVLERYQNWPSSFTIGFGSQVLHALEAWRSAEHEEEGAL